MLVILEKIAIAYSLLTLFIIELLYQTLKVLINGTSYSFKTLKNTLQTSFFELISDFIMLVIDFLQSLIEGINIGWHKAVHIFSDFKHNT